MGGANPRINARDVEAIRAEADRSESQPLPNRLAGYIGDVAIGAIVGTALAAYGSASERLRKIRERPIK